MTRTLAGKTILVSGGSRGIGLAIALRAARDGANFYTDEGVLREEGITDFSGYRLGDREEDLDLDFFPDAPLPERP
jgi:NAD(P)-dependent dehydrogenase (short-subunit alcohol dehydrogenase family)